MEVLGEKWLNPLEIKCNMLPNCNCQDNHLLICAKNRCKI